MMTILGWAMNAALAANPDLGDFLYRVVDLKCKYDGHGYLHTHTGGGVVNFENPTEWDLKCRSLPLVHGDEWEIVARSMWLGHNFVLLQIDRHQIENLSHRKHRLLPKHGEFFGWVNRKAIVSSTAYIWEKSISPPVSSISIDESDPVAGLVPVPVPHSQVDRRDLCVFTLL